MNVRSCMAGREFYQYLRTGQTLEQPQGNATIHTFLDTSLGNRSGTHAMVMPSPYDGYKRQDTLKDSLSLSAETIESTPTSLCCDERCGKKDRNTFSLLSPNFYSSFPTTFTAIFQGCGSTFDNELRQSTGTIYDAAHHYWNQ